MKTPEEFFKEYWGKFSDDHQYFTRIDMIAFAKSFASHVLSESMPSDEEIRKAILYGYNLDANTSLAQKDVINYNLDVFIEDYLKSHLEQQGEEKDEECEHPNHEQQTLRCMVCDDCGEILDVID